MKKSSKPRNKAAPQIDPYLEGLMGKLLDRLANLEKKMDTVIARTAAQPFQNQSAQTIDVPKRDRILFEAICADCSKVCEVPFKPSEGRAVYCKPCFAKRKSGGAGRINTIPRPVTLPQRPSAVPQSAPAASREIPKQAKKGASAKKPKKKK